MVVLYIIGISGIATSGDSLQVVVLLVFLQRLVLGVGNEHLSIDAGRVGTGFACRKKGYLIVFLLAFLQICEETQLVEGLVLVQVVKLAGNLLIATAHNSLTHLHFVVAK